MNNNEVEDLTNKEIDGRYTVLKKIGSGSFGQVYVAVSKPKEKKDPNEPDSKIDLYAVKHENNKNNDQLMQEYKVICSLAGGTGIPKAYWCKVDPNISNSVIMVMDMLGPSLEELFQLCDKSFSLKTVLMLADQMISRVEYVHSKNYIHRDIKPDNFLMGLSQHSNVVYLIDFGLARKYRDGKIHHHIPYRENKTLTGTARYASINSHLGIEHSRRDDLESIGYVLIYFLKRQLPWQKMKGASKQEKYHKIMEKKMMIPVEVLCKGIAVEFAIFLNYSQSLRFEDKPDYPFLRKLFRELFIREKFELDFLYDWTQASKISTSHTTPAGKMQIDLKLNRDINATALMQQNVDSIFQKGPAKAAPALGGNSLGGGSALPALAGAGGADKKSKFTPPPTAEAAANKEADSDSSKHNNKLPRKNSGEKLIPNKDDSESDKQPKKELGAEGIKIAIPQKKPALPSS